MQDLTVDYNEKKHSYDSVAAGLDSNMAKLEQEVKVIPLLIFLFFLHHSKTMNLYAYFMI